jgi:xylulokinase
LITPNGVIVATAFEPYPTSYPRPLWAEQDPGDWWRAIAVTTRRVLESAKTPPSKVLGMAFTTQMVNLIPVDAAGEPLRPCISWLDGRAGEEARGVMRRLGGGRIFSAIVGAMLTGKDLLPKMLWLKRNEPQLYGRTASLLDCSGYLLWKATRRMVAERSVASATGLLNLKSKAWDQTLIRFFGLDRRKFPELATSTELAGGLAPDAAQQLGLRAGTPVFAGAGDAQAAAVGAGAVGDGDGHLVLGTSGFVGVITARVGSEASSPYNQPDPGSCC